MISDYLTGNCRCAWSNWRPGHPAPHRMWRGCVTRWSQGRWLGWPVRRCMPLPWRMICAGTRCHAGTWQGSPARPGSPRTCACSPSAHASSPMMRVKQNTSHDRLHSSLPSGQVVRWGISGDHAVAAGLIAAVLLARPSGHGKRASIVSVSAPRVLGASMAAAGCRTSGSTRSGGHKAPRVGSLSVDDDARQPGSLDACSKGHLHWVPSAGPGFCAARPAAGAAGLPSRRAFPVERRGRHLGHPGWCLSPRRDTEATARRKAQEEIWPVPAYHVTRTQVQDCARGWKFHAYLPGLAVNGVSVARPARAGRGDDGAAALAGTHFLPSWPPAALAFLYSQRLAQVRPCGAGQAGQHRGARPAGRVGDEIGRDDR